MPIRIIFFGNSQTTNTKLIKRLINPSSYPASFTPKPSPASVEMNKLAIKDLVCELWNLSTELRFLPFRSIYYQSAELAVYCVDLNQPIDCNAINEELRQFRQANSRASLILLGINGELNPGIDTEAITEGCSFSLQEDEALAAFSEQLYRLAKPHLPGKIIALDKADLHLRNALLSIAVTLAITLLVVTTGIIIGSTFGLWAIPIACVVGTVVGSGAKMTSGLLTSYGLFTKNALENESPERFNKYYEENATEHNWLA